MRVALYQQRGRVILGHISSFLAFGNYGSKGIKDCFNPPKISEFVQNWESQVYEYWYCVLKHANSRPRSTIAVGWVKPPVNWVKLNMNSSTLGNPVLAGGGGLIRDCHGNQISSFARAIGFTLSIVAELKAVRDGLTQCCNISLVAVEVEIDASVAVFLLSQATHTNGEFSSLIDDRRNLMKNIPQVRLKHCFREANRCTDALASFGANMEDDFVVFEYPPSLIVSLLYSDKMGLSQDHICNIVVDATSLLIYYPVYPKKNQGTNFAHRWACEISCSKKWKQPQTDPRTISFIFQQI